jgi:hypothetical protein
MDATPPPNLEATNPDEPDPPAPGPSRRKLLVGLATALVVVVVAIGAWALVNDDDDNGSAAPGSSPAADASTTTTPAQRRAAAARARAEARAKAQAEGGSSTTLRPGATNPGGGTNGTGGGNGAGATTVPAGSGPPTSRTPDTVSPTVEVAYAQSYDQACRAIWAIAGPDGQLIDADDEDGRVFFLADCQDLYDSIDAMFYDTVEEARAGGIDDAHWNLSFEMTGNVLRNTAGTRTWSPMTPG